MQSYTKLWCSKNIRRIIVWNLIVRQKKFSETAPAFYLVVAPVIMGRNNRKNKKKRKKKPKKPPVWKGGSDWMSQLPVYLHDVPLTYLAIPGKYCTNTSTYTDKRNTCFNPSCTCTIYPRISLLFDWIQVTLPLTSFCFLYNEQRKGENKMFIFNQIGLKGEGRLNNH